MYLAPGVRRQRMIEAISICTTYAPYPVLSISGGVMSPITVLAAQFILVEIATPLALRLLGKISDGSAQGTGPQLAPKLTI